MTRGKIIPHQATEKGIALAGPCSVAAASSRQQLKPFRAARAARLAVRVWNSVAALDKKVSQIPNPHIMKPMRSVIPGAMSPMSAIGCSGVALLQRHVGTEYDSPEL